MENDVILVTNLPPQTTGNELTIYFQSVKKSGGGDVENVQLTGGTVAAITFESEEVHDRVLQREHTLRGQRLTLSLLPERAAKELLKPCPADQATGYDRTTQESVITGPRTVRVTGLPAEITEDAVQNYFENTRRSKGGDTESVILKLGLSLAFVTFCSPSDARSTAEHKPHVLQGSILDVKLLENDETPTISGPNLEDSKTTHTQEPDEPTAPLAFVVSGVQPQSTDDTLTNYLENSRRSGGGSVKQILRGPKEGEATVLFEDVVDLDRLLQGPHRLDGAVLNIAEKEPQKEIPLDQRKLCVSGLSEKTTEDGLELYLERLSNNNRVEQINRGYGDNVLVQFREDINFELLFKNAEEAKPLDGSKLHLQCVPECTAVVVTGLSDSTTEDAVELYFEHKKSGGGNVERVDFNKDDKSAVVHFLFPSVLDDVLKRTHTLDRMELSVQPYHPFLLDDRSASDQQRKFEVEIQVDPDVVAHITSFHQRELDTILDECHSTINIHKGSTTLAISAASKELLLIEEWRKQAKLVEAFIYSFEKTHVSFEAGIWEQIRNLFKMNEEESTCTDAADILFKDSDCAVQIIGKTTSVSEAVSKLHKIQKTAEENEELKRTVIKSEEQDIPRSKLLLLQSSGLCEEIEKSNQHLKITVNLKDEKICLEGPKTQLQTASVEIFTLISKVTESVFECPQRVLDVLQGGAGTAYVVNTLNAKGVKAIICNNQRKSTNEVLIAGENAKHTRRAEEILQEIAGEKSIHLKEENARLLNGKKWKDLKADVETRHIVKLDFDSHTSSLWISGVDEQVNVVAEIVRIFFGKNTILTEVVPLPKGYTRFLFEVLKDLIAQMRTDLAPYSFRIRQEVDLKGVEISGTAEGIDKGAAEIAKLCKRILDRNVPIDKPGLRKILSQGKVKHFLKSIEEEQSCVIEKIEETNESLLAPVEQDYGGASIGECKCSYVTPEGKKVSVYKDDLTRHQVDAIVNAANGKLHHIGGLAGAIVKVGGKQIQEECDAFIREKGPLLDGHVMVSKPGNLPCKKLIHAVGPIWPGRATNNTSGAKKTREEELLNYAILNCLEEAADVNSIAIPAISSGVFGFPVDLCAKAIIEAVVEFCKDNPTCILTDIHLTNNDAPTVKVFQEEMKKQFGHQSTFYDLERPTARRKKTEIPTAANTWSRRENFATKSYSNAESFHTAEGLSVRLVVGNIVMESVDVLVNTAAEDLQLEKNACAKAFKKAGGPKLQRLCDNVVQSRGSVIPAGEIAITGAAKLQQNGVKLIFHAVCSQWQPETGDRMVRQLFQVCLFEAAKQGMTSIAIPAIGTGTLQFPKKVVANAAFDQAVSFSANNPGSSLEEVKFVVFNQDHSTVQAFKTELQSRLPQHVPFTQIVQTVTRPRQARAGSSRADSATLGSAYPSVKERGANHFETHAGTICVQVKKGDITEETTDAIVVVSNPNLDLSIGGGAGAAILRKGGSSIQRKCNQLGPQQPGTVVAMKTENLKAKHLLHMVPEDRTSRADVKGLVVQCMQKADSLNLTSVSFPAIGTGMLGLSAKDCAKIMLSAAVDYSKENPRNLELVRITIFQPSMLRDFLSVMKSMAGVPEDEQPGMMKRLAKWIGFGEKEDPQVSKTADSEEVQSKVQLQIFAGCKENLEAAQKALHEMVDEHCKKKVIEKETIKLLTPENLKRLRTLQMKYDTDIKVETRVGRIVVRGDSEDLIHVISTIHEILDGIKEAVHEQDRAEMVAKDVQWYYEDRGKRVPYERAVNAEIEAAYLAKKNKVRLALDSGDYEINFKTWEESNLTEYDGERISKVSRKDLRDAASLPDFWVPQPKDQNGAEKRVHLVSLLTTSEAYQKVQTKFNKTCGQNILKIEQIQNPALYKTFAVRKEKMEEGGGSNEMLLFHGTAGENVSNINHHGFNRSYRGKNATKYGDGVYFAKEASFSARSTYSPADALGQRYMYVARVLVGDYTIGRPGLLTPPPKDVNDPTDMYDTVVDQDPNPNIFVAFYDWQYYADFLITFQ